MKQEIEALLYNGIWELVKCPQQGKPIGFKWMFQVKLKSYRFLDKYKACLVAKRFNRVEGIDYKKIYLH